jgi:hypothetical protein
MYTVQHIRTEGGKCVEHVRGKVQAGETKMYNPRDEMHAMNKYNIAL